MKLEEPYTQHHMSNHFHKSDIYASGFVRPTNYSIDLYSFTRDFPNGRHGTFAKFNFSCWHKGSRVGVRLQAFLLSLRIKQSALLMQWLVSSSGTFGGMIVQTPITLCRV